MPAILPGSSQNPLQSLVRSEQSGSAPPECSAEYHRGKTALTLRASRGLVDRPVDRINFIAATCRGLRVLDLGAMDETARKTKREQGVWLHEEIARSAKQVYGVDNSRLIPAAGLITAPNTAIQRGDITDPHKLLAGLDQPPEVAVAGEIIRSSRSSWPHPCYPPVLERTGLA